MRINRDEPLDDARGKIGYCLDKLENSKRFCFYFSWDSCVVPSLTLEEVIGTLIAAEQEFTLIDNNKAIEEARKERRTRRQRKKNGV